MQDGRTGRARLAAKNAAKNMNRFTTALLSAAIATLVFAGTLAAQPRPQAAAPVMDLNQIMRGLFFPHSNVVFATQSLNPAEIKRKSEPSTATDPLTGVFGNWEAVENSALLLSEAADFLMTPGRQCSNGTPMPLANPEWVQFVKALREAGVVAYKAAQTKDMDKMIAASEVLNNSCANCHNKFRPRDMAKRCQ